MFIDIPINLIIIILYDLGMFCRFGLQSHGVTKEGWLWALSIIVCFTFRRYQEFWKVRRKEAFNEKVRIET